MFATLDHMHAETLKDMKPTLQSESVECLLDEVKLWKGLL